MFDFDYTPLDTREDQPIAVGEFVLGGWQIVRMIGEGAQGTVYEVQKDHGRLRRALKIIDIPKTEQEVRTLRENYGSDHAQRSIEERVNRVAREICAMADIESEPAAVQIKDYQFYFFEQEHCWRVMILMELLTPLSDKLPQTQEEIVRLGLEIGSLLDACSKKKLLHRDIKPGNLFVAENGQYKLGDFGLTRSTDGLSSGFSQNVGTHGYMAPEVFRSMGISDGNTPPYDTRADLYSLAMVLYWLFNRQRLPFVASGDSLETALAKCMSGREPVPEIPGLSPALNQFLRKALAFHPQDRYATAQDFVRALRSAAGIIKPEPNNQKKTEPTPGRQTESPSYQQNKPAPSKFPKAALLAVVLLLVVIAVVIAVKSSQKQPIASPEPTAVQTPVKTEAPIPESTETPVPEPTDPPTPEPTVAPTPEPTETAVPILYGDTNGNGTINQADYAQLLAYLAADEGESVTGFDPQAGDLNQDGEITSADALLLKNSLDQNPSMTPLDTVRLYFEERVYGLDSYAEQLTGLSPHDTDFSLEKLSALASPDLPGTIHAAAYQTEVPQVLYEVCYPSKAHTIRIWVAVEYLDGAGWKLTGAADTYGSNMPTDRIDYAVPLISLNDETTHTLAERGSRATYRLLIPTAGRLHLVWQSGSQKLSRNSHKITMVKDSLNGGSVFEYTLQPSPGKQMSKDLFVAAGVYYVTVEALMAETEAYHFTIAFHEEEHVELENNDTYLSATDVSVNTDYSGALTAEGDIDFFCSVLDSASAVNITLKTPGNGSKNPVYSVKVLSADSGSSVSSLSVPGNALLTETGNLYLSPGTYLVQLEKGTVFTSDEYKLTVNVDQNGFMEAEPNDTQATANPVPVNEDIHASTGQRGDVDYFAFTLDESAVIQPRFTFKPTDSSSKTYVLTIMDSLRHELLMINIGGKESAKVIPPVALPAGTYTVKIENPRFIRQEYTLRLVSMAVDTVEKEPNDSAALATDLTMGQPYTGVLSSDKDIDYFKVTFAEQTRATIKFSFVQSTKKDTAFVLTVEQNGKTAKTWNVKGDTGGFEDALSFMPGEYYFKLKPLNWYSAVYTITLEE